MKLDNKGFTVIELVLSFVLVMFLALSMFSLVDSYKNREQKEAIRSDLLLLQNTLTQDIYQDTIERKVNYIRTCKDNSGKAIAQCININFLDNTEKQLKVVEIEEEATEDGTTFKFKSFYILYGGVKYENPDPKFATIVKKDMLSYTKTSDNLEYGVIYKIKLTIQHQDLEEKYNLDIVTTGLTT